MHTQSRPYPPSLPAHFAANVPLGQAPYQGRQDEEQEHRLPSPSVLLIEDETLLAEYMLPDLQKNYSLTFVESLASLQEKLQNMHFDYALVDLILRKEGEGLAAMSLLHSRRIPYLLFSSTCDENEIIAAMRCGAAGFVKKSDGRAALYQGLQKLIQGEYFFPDQIKQLIAHRKGHHLNSLSVMQHKVALKLLDKKLCNPGELIPENQQIADALDRSHGYIKNVIHALVNKLHISNGTRELLYVALKELGYHPGMPDNNLSLMQLAKRLGIER